MIVVTWRGSLRRCGARVSAACSARSPARSSGSASGGACSSCAMRGRAGRALPPVVARAVSPARRVGARPARAPPCAARRPAPRMSIVASAAVAPPPAAPAAALSPRTRLLLHGRIVPTLLRLAWPNVLVMLAQASTGLIETWWVSRLGLDALAGMALVFPGFMMMQMLSAGAMGGGISSSIARALVGGRRGAADALVLHAIIVNVA